VLWLLLLGTPLISKNMALIFQAGVTRVGKKLLDYSIWRCAQIAETHDH